MKNNKGITLIALIVTIIILLILAGVSLNLIAGSEGILNRATESIEKNNIASMREEIELALVDLKMCYYEENIEGPLKTYIITQLKKEYSTASGKITYDEETELVIYHTQKGVLKGTIDEQGEFHEIDSKDEENDSGNMELDEEMEQYKRKIAQTLTDLGVQTVATQSSEAYVENIQILANKNYSEGRDSEIILLKSNLSSRDKQTISLTNIEGYKNLDKESFFLVNKQMTYERVVDGDFYEELSYDANNGKLDLGRDTIMAGSYQMWNIYDVYAIRRTNQEVAGSSNIGTKNETLQEFKNKLAQVLENYGIKNSIEDKTADEISEDIKQIAKNNFKEGIETYMLLIQSDLTSDNEQTVAMTNIENYSELEIDDFFIAHKKMEYSRVKDTEDILEMQKTYDKNNGIFKFGIQKVCSNGYVMWNRYDVYILKKEIINLETKINNQ